MSFEGYIQLCDDGSGKKVGTFLDDSDATIHHPTNVLVDTTGTPVALATSAKQDTGNTSLAAIDAKLGATLTVTGTVAISGSVAVTGTFWQATQPVSAASLPLPTGASTAANQTTGNTTLSAINTELAALNAVNFATDTSMATLESVLNSIDTRVDGLEGFTDGIEALLSSQLVEDRVSNGAMAQQYDYVDATTEYLGWAEPGTATSAASWRVKKITTTGSDIAITWADSNRNFDNVWDNRASLTYG